MYVAMNETVATPQMVYRQGWLYVVPDRLAAEWIRAGFARESQDKPAYVQQLLDRLDDGAGQPCLFLPFVGEFGHMIMTHVRLVHWHKASRKVVCCRVGEECLYPSADEFVTDWEDPTPDLKRIGTMRERQPDWSHLIERYPGLHVLQSGGLTPEQELWPINAAERVPFAPYRRGLKADVVLGVRVRQFCPERNWRHWQRLADEIRRAGYSVAVIGVRPTTLDLVGQVHHSADYDTSAAVELLEGCQLYVGTDSGSSHLAAAVGAPMLVFREEAGGSRDLTTLMEERNPGRVEVVRHAWEYPDRVIRAVLARLEQLRPAAPAEYVAQHGEDRWLAANWDRLGLPERGTFCEVGAGDGIHCSNTWWLATTMKWRGVLVEPDPRVQRQLLANRPESILSTDAAAAEMGEAAFHLERDQALSGLERESFDTITVNTATLTDILADCGVRELHLLSIDTEGTELDVWAGLDLNRWRPRVVIIEWRTIGKPDRTDEIIERLTADGYELAEVLGGNLIFTVKG